MRAQRLEKRAQALEINGPTTRELEQHRPEFLGQPTGVLQKALQWLLRILQLPHVRQVAARLHREQETFR